MNKVSLRTKILVLVVLITAIPLSLVGYGNYRIAKQTVMEALIDNAYTKVRNNADNLAAWIDARRKEVEVMSRTDKVISGRDDERETYFRREAEREDSAFVTIGFADLNGHARLSDGSAIDISDEPGFRQSLKGETIVTAPFASPHTGRNIVVIQVPVYDAGKKVIGVVDAALLTERIYREHLDFHVGASDLIFLYSDIGEMFGGENADGEPSVGMTGSVRDPESPFASAASDMLGKEYGYSLLKGGQGDSYVFFANVAGTSWRIGLHVPLHEIERPLVSIMWRTALTIALAEAVMILLLFLLTNRIVARIKRILTVTEAASAGRFDVPAASEDGFDEIAQLAHSVNDMRVHLRDMFGRMDAMINQNQFAFIMLDENFRVTYFSAAAERMLGYKAEEVVGRATGDIFVDPADLREEARRLGLRLGREIPADAAMFRELRKEQFSYEREWTYVRKDGSRIPVAYSFSGIRDRDGKFVGIASIARDITQQKLAENARSQQLEVMEAAKDLIATFDEQGRLLYLNPAGRNLLGVNLHADVKSAEVVSKRTIAGLLHGLAIARELGFQESEALLTTMRGDKIPVSKILVAHSDDRTGGTFYSCIARDISEQKKGQAELVQAKREAEEANMAKGQFLARMSHEIRTPLAGIIGLISLLQKTELSELQQDYLDKTRASSEALLAIINDILDFAKVEAGKIRLSEVPFDPWQMIHRLAELLGIFVGGKEQFEFIVEVPDDLPSMLVGDPLRLEQVLLNLSINAIKFTDRGHVRLSLEQVLEEGEGAARIRFAVEDTGIGMSQEQLGHLFKPFMQVDGDASRKYGGTGLGLVIVKSLVGMMGGNVEVSSAPGRGSRFEFTVRLPVASAGRKERFRIGDERELSVWLAEDYPLMSRHLSAELEAIGLSVIAHESWRSVHDRLRRAGIGILPDALLLDFEMPDMFGEETWLALRDAADQAGIPVVALTTAYGREELLKLEDHARPAAIIVKPLERIALYQALLAVFASTVELESAASQSAAAAELPKPGGAMILLAEDNKINQLVTIEQLREWGFTVEVAETGAQALSKLEEKRWDMILMDIHMPEMDGDEAARIIRLDSKYDRIPIIALTANIIREDHERYIQLGMNDVLTKPIQPEKMLQVISQWLLTGAERRPADKEAEKALYEPMMAHENGLSFEVPGMDTASALERVNGKRDILGHMLKLFVKDYARFEEHLRIALQSGDYSLARRMTHTLKGVAGNLSAAELAAMADQLETLLKAPVESRDPIAISSAAACVQIVLKPMISALKVDMIP